MCWLFAQTTIRLTAHPETADGAMELGQTLLRYPRKVIKVSSLVCPCWRSSTTAAVTEAGLQMAQSIMQIVFQPEDTEALQAVAQQMMQALEQALNKSAQQHQL